MHIQNPFVLDRELVEAIKSRCSGTGKNFVISEEDKQLIDGMLPAWHGIHKKVKYAGKIDWLLNHSEAIWENFERMEREEGAVRCAICGMVSHQLYSHIARTHKIKCDEYKNKYNSPIESELYIKNSSERIKGGKNPAAGHGGKFSPFSMNFVGYEGLTEEEKKVKINELKIQSEINKNQRGNNNTTIEYYLKRGMNEQEAKEALKNRQAVFSLEICIEKYGEEEGKRIWKKRQEKWRNTLDSKSDEEKEIINKKKNNYAIYSYILRGYSEEEAIIACNEYRNKTFNRKEFFGNCYSKESIEFFLSFIPDEILMESQYASDEFFIEANERRYFYDFRYKNVVIEYHGEAFHPNPKMSDEYLSEWRQAFSKETASEVFERDRLKRELVESKGLKYFEIYSNDSDEAKEMTKVKILEAFKQ